MASCKSHKTQGPDFFKFFSSLLPAREAVETRDSFHNQWIHAWRAQVWARVCAPVSEGACMGVSVSMCYVGSAGGWPESGSATGGSLGKEGRACDRLRWLVELSGQNLSDSAKAMNHFGLQLCNLSPTPRRIMYNGIYAALARTRLQYAWLSCFVHLWICL